MKNRKLQLSGLARNQFAIIDDAGRVQVRSNDLRGKNNYGLISNLGVALNRLFMQSPPFKPKMDYDYQRQQCQPLIYDPENNMCLF